MYVCSVDLLSVSFSLLILYVFFFKQKTAYEMRISDWSSDVCSSDLIARYSAESRSSKTPLASSKSPRLVLRYMMDRDSAEYRAICQTSPALPSLLLSRDRKSVV